MLYCVTFEIVIESMWLCVSAILCVLPPEERWLLLGNYAKLQLHFIDQLAFLPVNFEFEDLVFFILAIFIIV